MRIRKWEKWYWGIVLSLATIFIVGFCFVEKVEVTIFGDKRTYTEFKDKLKAGLIAAAIIIGIALVIWLIIRLFSKDDKDK